MVRFLIGVLSVFVGLSMWVGSLYAEDFSEPLSLQKCVRIAIENNIQLALSEYDVESQKKNITHARSGFLPGVSLSSRVSNSGGESFFGNVKSSFDQKSASFGFSATQNLFRGGYDYYNLKAAKASTQASLLNLGFSKNGITYLVQQKYYDLLKKRRLQSVREEDLALSEKQLELAQALNEVGSAAKSDVLRAKATLAQKKLNLLNAQNDVNLSKADLSSTLGIDLNIDYGIVDIDIADFDAFEENSDAASPDILTNEPTELTQIAYENRLDLEAGRMLHKSAQATVKRARRGYLPSISLYGNYNWSNNDSPIYDATGNVVESKENLGDWINVFDGFKDWNYGVQLSFDIFDGFSREASYDQSKLSAHSSRKDLDQKKLDIALEVKQSYLNMTTAHERIKQAGESLKAAEEDLRLAEERYRLGVATIVDLNTAQLGYTNAKTSHIEAIYDFETAKANMDYVLGK
ncbi:MAG: hypothetical protein B6244_14225 [Candidatus Cloacimonetes bacterium 4572_55]|nr:MAG: hypothetical protein B6244_14225 [Candidatus Cloacimonetes bacterium 4572_55]